MMSESGLGALRLLIAYSLRVSERLPTDQEHETIKKFIEPRFEEELMTVAERLEARGRKVGRQEGKQEGRQEGRQEGLEQGRHAAMAEMVLQILVRR